MYEHKNTWTEECANVGTNGHKNERKSARRYANSERDDSTQFGKPLHVRWRADTEKVRPRANAAATPHRYDMMAQTRIYITLHLSL